MNQKVMVKMLAKYGYQITIANDGREGVAIFEATDPKSRFECILMDIQVYSLFSHLFFPLLSTFNFCSLFPFVNAQV